MNKEQQDLNWKCLPKETRDYIKNTYPIVHYPVGDAMIDLFGSHNLTSDTEPDEMLMVPRKEVQEYFTEINKTLDKSRDREIKLVSMGKQIALKSLYGIKCLPDEQPKAEEIINTTKDTLENPIQTPETPKNWMEKKTVLVRVKPKELLPEALMGFGGKIMKVIKYIPTTGEYVLESREDEDSCQISQDYFEIYQELNLCELLEGFEGTRLYSTIYGGCTFKCVYKENNNGHQPLVAVTLEDGTPRNFTQSGRVSWAVEKFAPISLYPSFELFQKYPLPIDAYKAWMEWEDGINTELEQIIYGCDSENRELIKDHVLMGIKMAIKYPRRCIEKLIKKHE